MAYTSNPYAPKARRLAVNLVRVHGKKAAEVARMYGVHRATIGKWLKRAPKDHRIFVVTHSSRPHSHPRQLSQDTVSRLIVLRKKLRRCAPVLHAHLLNEGYTVSLTSVGRTLKRNGLTRKKKQAQFCKALHPRPLATFPGALIQMDTIHYVRSDGSRLYLYTLIDVYSCLAYAEYHQTLSQSISFTVVQRAQHYFHFPFTMIQTDHGPEFRNGFLFFLNTAHMKLRHSRVRKPNDNAHIERFNRTIQEECFSGRLPNEHTVNRVLKAYLDYYNYGRLHLGLKLVTPAAFVAKVLT